MSTSQALAVLCGAMLGIGLWSLVSLTPRLSRPRLADRVAPYVLDVSAEARLYVGRTSTDPIPVLGALFAPLFNRATAMLSAVLGGRETVTIRLHQSGSTKSVQESRSEQLLWALIGCAGGLLAVVTVPQVGDAPLVARVLLPFLVGIGGGYARDIALQSAAKARMLRIESELPTVLEFLTLSLAAGEGILDSLRRVSSSSSGELSGELSGVMTEVRLGVPLADSLQRMSQRLQLPSLTRCVDQITNALERGSPLAEVLRAQAQDAREETKRRLLETVGKKEVAMLVPLVFLILPLTVVFAIFPGIFVLQAGF
ncbi:type II secretion system F family protein [Leifsonia sp. A12D58]|uniref:type II secretion system F family protein n=1 Tax=Leifsonia sp. A12D58 TaxID=3397674 RepID=UPI0039E19277